MKRNSNLILVLILLAVILPRNRAFSQGNEVYIYTNSSDSVINRYLQWSLHAERVYNQPYRLVPPLDWRDSLPDGIYYYFDEHHTEKHKYLMRGQFHNSVRVGKFEYWYIRPIEKPKRKQQRELGYIFGYTNDGLLDGHYIANYGGNWRYEEGYYEKGKRHGFFVTYEFDETFRQSYVGSIELYRNDTLIYKSHPNKATQAIEVLHRTE